MNFSYWLNTETYSSTALGFAVFGDVAWIITYILLIRSARKRNFMEMPLFIAIGNLAWETIYSFVYPEYMNLGMAISIGVKSWFFLDCYICYLSWRTVQNNVQTPLIRQYILLIGILLFAAWYLFIWSIAQIGLDNMPLGSSGKVRFGGTSAYILNTAISLLFIFQYLRLYNTHTFSKGVAWFKMIGTCSTTILFSLVDSQNTFLLMMGGIVLVCDMIYVALLYLLPPTQGSITIKGSASILVQDIKGEAQTF